MTNGLAARRPSTIRSAIALAAAPIALCLLAFTLGCGGAGANADVEKAQIAVRANPSLELMATDDRQGVLTVRVRRSGRVMTVSIADVISGIAFRDIDSDAPANAQASGGGNTSGSSRVAVSGPNGQLTVDRTKNGVAVSSSAGQVDVRQSPGGGSVSASTPESQVAVRRSGNGVDVSSSAGDVSARRSTGGGANVSTPEAGTVAVRQSGNGVAVATPDAQVGVRQTRDGGLAVSTPGAQVKIGADGISVDDTRRAATNTQRAPAAGSTSPDPSGKGAVIDEARLERRSRPVACQGDGTVDLVDVLLQVDGIAISSLGGCRIHIKNSHIIGGVAIKAVGGSTVTIENSIMEGRTALSLEGSVNMSVQSSTIRGSVSRLGSTTLRDLGNNLWK